MGYVLAYTVHNFELFAFRSWMVAFFVYSASTHANQTLILSATAWAAISSLLGLPFSVLGNELSKRIGRHRAITILMWLSALIAGGLGFAAELPFTIVVALTLVYGVLVTAESPSITAGLINAAPTGYRGATMAVHSCIGFIGSFLGPVAFGFVLEMVGSTGNITFAWGWAFFMCGIIVALGPIFLFICRPLGPQ
jgi:MFS family permease